MTNNKKITLSNYGYNILQIETIAACNMECSFCPYPLKEDKISTLNLEVIKKILNQIDQNDKKFKYVTFSQFNEPLLDKRIFEIIQYAKNIGLKVLMITNGLLLNKEKNINSILQIKPNMKISLQVLDRTQHKQARGLNLEIEKYIKTIVNFCKKVKNQQLNITIDIGSNFNNKKFNYILRKILGLQTGDPSVPIDMNETIDQFKEYLEYFYEITDKEYKDNLSLLSKQQRIDKIFNKLYKSQEGFKVYNNVTLKIKPFFYGRKIKDFKPRNEKNFSCNTNILGIQADGNIVPCCLAYDDSISLGKIYNNSLKTILHKNIFLENLRNKQGKKHLTCRKCFGEPTYRGVFLKNIYTSLPKEIRNSKLINFIK